MPQVWDLQGSRKAGEWRFNQFGHEAPLTGIGLCGESICTASTDGTLRVTRCPVFNDEAEGLDESQQDGEAADAGVPPGGSAQLPEDILRGVDDAAAQLQQSGAF